MQLLTFRKPSASAIGVLFLSIACLSSYGWVLVYPYSGYTTLFFFALGVVLTNQSQKNLFFFSISSLCCLIYLLWPREYAGPSTAQYISAIVFIFLIFLSRGEFSKVNLTITKLVIVLCFLSLGVQFFSYLFPLPYLYIDADGQIFNVYMRLYVDRVNITKSIGFSFVDVLFGQRFHGPFFEPGFLGAILGVALFSKASGIYRKSIYFFGVLSLSMTFFFLVSMYAMSVANFKKRMISIVVMFCVVALYFIYGDSDSFFYRSIFERFLGTGDKVLDTRSSIYESEQISLFWNTVYYDITSLFFGLGFDVPGSGGSYRVWLMGAGIFGTMVIWSYFSLLILKIKKGRIFRLLSLLLLCYIFGFWMMPFYLFLLEE